MMREPWFWQDEGVVARGVRWVLWPFSVLYQSAFRFRSRVSTPKTFHQCVVVCVGNISVGGVGKTPFSLMLYPILKELGYNPAFATRGYGGHLTGPVQVDLNAHTASDVGDEPLLLAACAPTFVAANRSKGIKLAERSGHDAVIVDDGFQNPTFQKDVSILLLDKRSVDQSAATLPAGFLREPLSGAVERADMTLLMNGAQTEEPIHRPAENFQFQASTVTSMTGGAKRVFGFCAIANPDRFRHMLEDVGFDVCGFTPFPDHHSFTPFELDALHAEARRQDASLITTQKDQSRLGTMIDDSVLILPITTQLDDRARFQSVLKTLMDTAQKSKRGGARP